MFLLNDSCSMCPYVVGLRHLGCGRLSSPGVPCRASRVLEGGIKMQDRSNLRCRLLPPMRHADTYGRHLGEPYVGYVPGEIHVSTVKSLSRRSVPALYEWPVELSGLRLLGYRGVAACHCSFEYTRGVPIWVGTVHRVLSLRDGVNE